MVRKKDTEKLPAAAVSSAVPVVDPAWMKSVTRPDESVTACPPLGMETGGPLETICTGIPAAAPSAADTCSTIGCAKKAPGVVTCSIPDATRMQIGRAHV